MCTANCSSFLTHLATILVPEASKGRKQTSSLIDPGYLQQGHGGEPGCGGPYQQLGLQALAMTCNPWEMQVHPAGL